MSKEATMPTYVSLINWTDQGIKTVKDSGTGPSRRGRRWRPRAAGC